MPVVASPVSPLHTNLLAQGAYLPLKLIHKAPHPLDVQQHHLQVQLALLKQNGNYNV